MKPLNRLVWLGILMALGLTSNASLAAELLSKPLI